jgi:hypothetical protein
VEYLGNNSGKNLRGINGEISGQYFRKDYNLFADINLQTNILK